ncbi:uncharacterized protein HGUI_03962 [Hanseniaspora guilliermondii]|uniref:Nudix hydrolase domain-containing protein n=1 Tax=Hanseniaspora guilliermondii TaxID=56406 RepID=A0A1L0CT58_9ASCO|nr:uncharacterized protein HGUI_03962 [Hanseniaspora guilliermondii]
MSSVSTGVAIKPSKKYSTSPDLKKVYFNFKRLEKQVSSFKPLQVTTNKSNYQFCKNYITNYSNGTDGQRETQLFIKGYRIVAGCIIIDEKTQKVMLLTYGNSHHYHSPKGGVEIDELKYTKTNRTENYEGIPNVGYSFMESALRETWEEAGVKGTISKELGLYYYYDSSVITDKLHEWVNKKPKKFPKSIEYYYEMKVEEVCDVWPDGPVRPRKWFGLQECLDELVSNGRYAQFKAVLKSSLVKNKNDIYRDQFRRDALALEAKQEYWPRLYNKKYKKVSEDYSGAEVYVCLIVYNHNREILVNDKQFGICINKVLIEHEPYVWRSSDTFKANAKNLTYGKLVSVDGYDPVKGVDKSGVFDLGQFRKCIQFYSATMKDSSTNTGKWLSIKAWQKEYKQNNDLYKLILKAVDSGEVENVANFEPPIYESMQLEIDRLKGDLARTKNELTSTKITLAQKK